jgi:hypothetical protein
VLNRLKPKKSAARQGFGHELLTILLAAQENGKYSRPWLAVRRGGTKSRDSHRCALLIPALGIEWHRKSTEEQGFFCACCPARIDPDGHRRTLLQVFAKIRGAAGHASRHTSRGVAVRRFESYEKRAGAFLAGQLLRENLAFAKFFLELPGKDSVTSY